MLPKQTRWLTGIKILIIAGILLFSTSATASTMTLNVHTDFFGFNNIDVTYNGNSLTVDAGEFQIWYTQGNYTSGYFPAFCVDLSTTVHYGENDIDGILTPGAYDTSNGLYVEWLVDYAFSSDTRIEGSQTAGAGLQLAIWEVLYDFSNDLQDSNYNLNSSSGIFSYDNSITTSDTDGWYQYYIDSFVTQIDNVLSYTSSGEYKIVQLSTGQLDSQDLITTVVPEPATILLFGMGLLGIGAIGRKRRI